MIEYGGCPPLEDESCVAEHYPTCPNCGSQHGTAAHGLDSGVIWDLCPVTRRFFTIEGVEEGPNCAAVRTPVPAYEGTD